MMKKILVLSLLPLSLLLCLPAAAHDTLPPCEHCDTAHDMAVFDTIAKEVGLSATDFEHRDLLTSEEQRYYTLLTEPKRTYYIAAVCDEDCTDLDTSVWQDDENLETDYKMDANPVIKFTAKGTSYRVRVDMEDCANSACFAHIKAYVK